MLPLRDHVAILISQYVLGPSLHYGRVKLLDRNNFLLCFMHPLRSIELTQLFCITIESFTVRIGRRTFTSRQKSRICPQITNGFDITRSEGGRVGVKE